ncbi:MAG TPA: phage terminase large subunit [Niabella sp.]|nr:phage terminase large subunit [Niabella sp.]
MTGVILDPNNKEGKDVNPKQIEFYNAVMTCVGRIVSAFNLKQQGKSDPVLEDLISSDHRYFFYGGSIRGGKTYICVTIIVLLCLMFPKSRWLVVRKSFPDLERTVVETFKKILGTSPNGKWNHSPSNFYFQMKNGSTVMFMAENYTQDKNFTRFLGLEINGVLFEQIEEITEAGYDMICSRLGSWKGYSGVEPPAFVLANFNPTYSWVKKRIDDPGMKGGLPKGHYFLEALSTDNPFKSEEQWRAWQNLDPETYSRMILGEREIEVKGAFLYGFNPSRNTGYDLKIDTNYSIYLSFDFNVDPMTCLVMQTDYENFIHVIREIRIPNSDTYEMCTMIKPLIEGLEHLVIVTGDASGKNRQSAAYGHANQYQIIMQELELSSNQFKILEVNPSISDSRTFCNSVITKFPSVLVNHECEWLIKDLMFVTASTDINGDICIQKGGQNIHLNIDNKHLGHLMDCFRYCLHIMLPKWFITTKKAITS